MEEQILRPRRHRRKKHRLRLLIPVLLLLIAAGLLMFRVNRFALEIVLDGSEKMTLEYGARYEEPGVRAVLKGSLFWKEGIPLPIQVRSEGTVDGSRLGENPLLYRASLPGFHGEASRTVLVVDTQPPVITLTPDPPEGPPANTPYQEAGYTATDNYDGDITHRVIRTETDGLVTYTVLDSSGNPCYAQREIPIVDTQPPVITLSGDADLTVSVAQGYDEPGYTAQDNLDGDLTQSVAVEGSVDRFTPGTYDITYTVSDSRGNTASAVRHVTVAAQAPVPTVTPKGKVIYLTFDDGPGPYTQQLLDVLKKHDVKATFFVVGGENPELLRKIAQEGHSIGIHTMSHDYEAIYSDPEAFFEDLLGEQEIIFEATGIRTTLMRFPGGSSNTISRKYHKGIMTTLTEAVQNAGFRYFDWNVDSDDAGRAHTAKKVLENVREGVQAHRVSVVLQHDIHPYSVEAVEDIILWGLENGYRFLPLEENSPTAHHGVQN